MHYLLFLYFFSSFFLFFFNQNIINLIAFYCLYKLAVKFYSNLTAYDSELEHNLWIELIRSYLTLRVWSMFLLRFHEQEIRTMLSFFISFLSNLQHLISVQQRNMFLVYKNSLVKNKELVFNRLSENESYFDLFINQNTSNSSFLTVL